MRPRRRTLTLLGPARDASRSSWPPAAAAASDSVGQRRQLDGGRRRQARRRAAPSPTGSRARRRFCLPRAQLAISGIMVVERGLRHADRADQRARTCTRRTSRSRSTPQRRLQRVDHRAARRASSSTTAAAQRGRGEAEHRRLAQGHRCSASCSRTSPTSTTPDDMTVVVKTKVPWVAFPAYLWTSGRAGIAAPAQLNDDADLRHEHDRHRPVQGRRTSTRPPVTSSVVKNPDYWRKGFPLPRRHQLQDPGGRRPAGERSPGRPVRHHPRRRRQRPRRRSRASAAASTRLLEPTGCREIGQTLLNVTRPPLDDLNIRKAIAMAVDRDALNQIANKGNVPSSPTRSSTPT